MFLIMLQNPKYKIHSIGQHIVKTNLYFGRREKVSHVLKTIREDRKDWPNSENIFVVNSDKKLIGIIDFNKLVNSKPDARLEEIMSRKFEAITDHSHQYHVARLAIKRGAETIPVIDQQGVFLGIIDAGQTLKILHEEHIEDLMRFSGIMANEAEFDTAKISSQKMVIQRLPWLILGLLGGIFATKVVSLFDHTLEKELSLACFIPVIVYINAAVGAQTQTILVRSLSFEKVDIKRFLFKELRVVLIMGFVLSISITAFAFLWLKEGSIAPIIGLSMFAGVLSSAVVGTLIPTALSHFKKDPAIGTGPFATVIQDILSLVIYFTIANLLLF